MFKKFYLLIIIGILPLFLSACSVFEQKEDIVIAYTNDVAGEVNGPIGYAGVRGFLDRIRNEEKYVFLTDSGDFLEGDLAQSGDGLSITKIMNGCGYGAVCLGNQEFSQGLSSLSANMKEADFPYLSCNIRYLGEGSDPLKGIKPYKIKWFGFTRVAFIGVTTPETILKEGKPSYEALVKDGVPQYSFYEGEDGKLLYEQIQKTVDKVRNRADYVVLLSHLGSNSTLDGYSSYDVIANTTGIDVVIDGHSHTVISGEAVANRDGEMVVLTSTGEKLQNIGLLRMHPDHSFTTTLYPTVEERNADVQVLIDQLAQY